MHYVHYEPGAAELMHLVTGDTPPIKPDEVLIRVTAAGVNRPDVMQRQGLYPPPEGASPILGLEVAGEVVAVGEQVRRWQLGDSVCALVNGGGYASHVAVAAAQCLPLPAGFTWQQAAALPETLFTVWHNLMQRARLQSGETLLVHGGSSGIGIMAIQLARALGVRVFATAGSDAKCEACAALGAEAINYRTQDFVSDIKARTEGRGVDVILDMVGGSYIQKNIAVAAKDGRIVSIAFMQGSTAEINFMPLMLKRLTLTGSTLRAQSPAAKALIAQELEAQVWPLLAEGKIRPLIDRVYSFALVVAAHQRMESSEHIGKLVLSWT